MRNGFKVSDLSGDAVYVTSTPIDWQEARGEDGEGWESFEGTACEGCGSIVALRCGEGNGPHCDCADGADLSIDCNGHVATAEGPMMSYFYRVKLDDCEGAARRASGAWRIAKRCAEYAGRRLTDLARGMKAPAKHKAS